MELIAKTYNHLNKQQKNLWGNLNCFRGKTPRKYRIRESIPQYNKGYNNIVLKEEKPEAIPIKPGIRYGYPPTPLVFHIMPEIQTGTKGKKRTYKGCKRKSSHTILICR